MKLTKVTLLCEDISSIHGNIEPCIVKSLNRFRSKLQSRMSQILNFTKSLLSVNPEYGKVIEDQQNTENLWAIFK